MVGTSLVLIALAVLVLRNQVRPIQKLADAAERFGRGRPVDDYRPYGALEVRRAAWAFIEMRRRIERQIEQRTTMLTGVSHDLRTILTRFRLEIELLGDNPDLEPMKRDVEAMQAMLEDYLAFARTEVDEHSDTVELPQILTAVAREVGRSGAVIEVDFAGEGVASVKPLAFRRMLSNIVVNASRFADRIRIEGRREGDWVIITVDDNGPGIPEELREEAFRPFHRMESGGARNQDHEGTGLGLTIARDIARGHGGEIRLGDAPLGGLRVDIRIPV
jgi:two-component system osmolarity sensor histidine kinase EnvZ